MTPFDLLKAVGKFTILWIVDALCRMKGQRKHLERINSLTLVVLAHVDKETLLVRQLLILLKSVIEAKWEDGLLDLCQGSHRLRLIYKRLLFLFLFGSRAPCVC